MQVHADRHYHLCKQVWFDALLGGGKESCAVDHFRKTDGGEGPPLDLPSALQQVRGAASGSPACVNAAIVPFFSPTLPAASEAAWLSCLMQIYPCLKGLQGHCSSLNQCVAVHLVMVTPAVSSLAAAPLASHRGHEAA